MPEAGYLVIRSEVSSELDRAKFDHWYSSDHMPRAIAAFGANRGWRFWSRVDPAFHYAVYEYGNVDELLRRVGETNPNSRLDNPLSDEFRRMWPQVAVMRDVIVEVDKIGEPRC